MQIIFTPDEDEPEDNVVPLSKSKTNLKLVVNNGEEEM